MQLSIYQINDEVSQIYMQHMTYIKYHPHPHTYMYIYTQTPPPPKKKHINPPTHSCASSSRTLTHLHPQKITSTHKPT